MFLYDKFFYSFILFQTDLSFWWKCLDIVTYIENIIRVRMYPRPNTTSSLSLHRVRLQFTAHTLHLIYQKLSGARLEPLCTMMNAANNFLINFSLIFSKIITTIRVPANKNPRNYQMNVKSWNIVLKVLFASLFVMIDFYIYFWSRNVIIIAHACERERLQERKD